jgi:acetolactate synthase I/II/III large subunit
VKIKGAQLVLKCLKELGVDTIFGYPGGAVIPIYDALYDEKELRHIITAHEQGATHAADGYARATGKVGVVLATSGPGATNTVTGIATACRDSIPLLVITGQVMRNLLERDSFQEVNITDITASITKKSYLVKEVDELPKVIKEAFILAQSGRPGPVLIDIPKDIQTTFTEYLGVEENVSVETRDNDELCKEEIAFDSKSMTEELERAVEAINKCSRPMIYAGGGVVTSGAHEELLKFVEKIKSPVACSLMGLGGFPGDHQYFTGMIGMHGTHCSNHAVTDCDLLLAIGSRFSDRVASDRNSFADKATVIHIDIDPKEFSKNIKAHIPLCGDVKAVLKLLIEKVSERQENQWNEVIRQWKEQYPLNYKYKGLSPQYVLNRLCELSEDNSIITTEVGQNQMWTAQYYTFKQPRTFLTSGGLGTMGFGLGAAIGAAFGRPDKKVVNVAGDGSFKMNSIELATVSKYKVPLIQLVFNNHALGMVRQWQEMFCDGRLSFTQLEPDVDFIKLAAAYGIKAMKISSNEDVDIVLKEALSLKEPVLIECEMNEEDKVFPMVAPGAPVNKIIYNLP